MNTLNISLSSSSTNTVATTTLNVSDDYTEVILDLRNLYYNTIPMFLKIDWGDGVVESIDNDVYNQKKRGETSLTNANSMFTTKYRKSIYPSNNSLYKNFTIQVYVQYSDGEYSWFRIPISIRTYDYFESLNDLTLLNVNILPDTNNPKEYQLLASESNSIIELRNVY
jgi:hypothetical protein